MNDIPPLVPKGRKYTRPKPNPTSREHYGTKHQKLRLQRLAQHPICERCQAAFSTQAHHLVYPARSVDDYQALCEGCHKEEHRR